MVAYFKTDAAAYTVDELAQYYRNAMDFSLISVRGLLSGGPGCWLRSVTGMGVARVSFPGGRPVPRPAVSGRESERAAVRPQLARRR